MSEYYTHIKPKMTDFDIQVRIDVVSTKVIIGTQINVDDLSKGRHFLRFRNAVTIKINLAYAMIRCANIKNGDLVVDVSIIPSRDLVSLCITLRHLSHLLYGATFSALLWKRYTLIGSTGLLSKANQMCRYGCISAKSKRRKRKCIG